MKTQHLLLSTLLLAAVLTMLAPVQITVAAPSADITVDGSTCTLADAITAANTDTAAGGCTAGSGDDTLIITSDINLTAEPASVQSVITIEGGGHTITGNGTFAVLDLGTTGVPGNLTLNNTTISGGQPAIRVTDASMLTVNASTISNNGGNPVGGGIELSDGSSAVVENSTISDNTSSFVGGGIGIADSSSSLIVRNSTITQNNAGFGGGIGMPPGPGATVTVQNSIVASQNSGGDCTSAVTSQGFNIESATSCGFTSTGDFQNTDPHLSTLTNGVRVPLSNSPAIDGGNPATPGSGGTACFASDQRGQARDDLRCDIGAVEVKLSDTDTVIKSVGGSGTFTFGPTLAKIEVTTQGSLSELSAQVHSGDHPNATRMNGQWWGIMPTGSGYTVNLDLPHSVTPDTNAKVCKWLEGSGPPPGWDCDRSGSDASRVWRNGITELSDWAVGDNVSATAISLRAFSAQNSNINSMFSYISALLALLLVALAVLGLRARKFADRRQSID